MRMYEKRVKKISFSTEKLVPLQFRKEKGLKQQVKSKIYIKND